MNSPNRKTTCAAALSALLALGASAGAEESQESKAAATATDELKSYIAKQAIDTTQPGWRTRLPKFPALTFDLARTYSITFDTSKGSLTVKLFADSAPAHAANFLYLATLGFFDGLTFHRVIPGFMAQGGCPLGVGSGSPGYRFAGEFTGKEKHDRPGLLSMANAGPGTDGSQFFLTFVPAPWLDGKHTIFGEVVSGSDTLKALEHFVIHDAGPTEKLTITKATVSIEPAAPAKE